MNQTERISFKSESLKLLRSIQKWLWEYEAREVFHNNQEELFLLEVDTFVAILENDTTGKSLLNHLNSLIDKKGKTNKTDIETAIQLFKRNADHKALTQHHLLNLIRQYHEIEKQIDIKTMALSKYGFNKELTKITEKLRIGEIEQAAFMIFDQNDLKDINENYGHETGQHSIRKFGEILKKFLDNHNRNYVLSNYFGGDEWYCIILETSYDESQKLVRQFFEELKKNHYEINSHLLPLSGTCGILRVSDTLLEAHPIEEPRMFMKLADHLTLLAKAKKSHRSIIKAERLGTTDPSELKHVAHAQPASYTTTQLKALTRAQLTKLRDEEIKLGFKARTKRLKAVHMQNLKKILKRLEGL